MDRPRTGLLIAFAVVGSCVGTAGLGWDVANLIRGDSGEHLIPSLLVIFGMVWAFFAWKAVYLRYRGEHR